MKKSQQLQILDLLKTLGEGQSAGLYADCQDCALFIGEFIESIKGEGTQTVSLLEEYCELLFKANNGEISKKPLEKQLIKIENCVKTELKPNRFEIAFLSYKASMSDSIESIYLAAKEDPMCDAYWIPIPYFTRNADGSLGTLQYEGADFYGEKTECIDWREYDIESRRPDVIFTFAPLDDLGKMTSVHPDFYCERLRELTDLLVYIPYFVTTGAVHEDFVQCNGVLYAHLVVLDSEEVKDTFAHHYLEFDKHGYSKAIYGHAKDKFVVLGSPKYDAVINSKPDDFIIPEKWQEKMKNQDKTGKKVILYNTTIHTALNEKENLLTKIRSVFESFKERDDIVLWWRPHPLLRTAFSGVHAHLLAEYDRIVEEYKNAGWGIYDDTPDLHRAIACTDMYYGDWSSVALLYKKTGKPVVFQDTKTPYAFSELDTRYPGTFSVINNSLYFFLPFRNALLTYDFDTFLPSYSCAIPDKPVFGQSWMYQCCEAMDGKLYFVPLLCDDIAILDCETNSLQVFHLELHDKCITTGKGNFRGIMKYGDMLFLLPVFYSSIIAYDIKTGKTTHCLDLKSIFPQSHESKRYFSRFEWLNASRILLPSVSENAVLEFDLDDYSYVLHTVGGDGTRLGNIVRYKDHFWVVPLNKPTLIKWNHSENTTEEFSAYPVGFDKKLSDKETYFARNQTIKYKSYLYLFPCHTNMVCRLDMENSKIEHLEEFDRYCIREEGKEKVPHFSTLCIHGDKIYLWTKENILLEYDLEPRDIREHTNLFDLSTEDYKKLSSDFLNSFSNGTETSITKSLPDKINNGNAGKSIYDYVKKRAFG